MFKSGRVTEMEEIGLKPMQQRWCNSAGATALLIDALADRRKLTNKSINYRLMTDFQWLFFWPRDDINSKLLEHICWWQSKSLDTTYQPDVQPIKRLCSTIANGAAGAGSKNWTRCIVSHPIHSKGCVLRQATALLHYPHLTMHV